MAKERGEDMRADSGAYDAEEVVSSVEQHLRAIRGDEPSPKPEPEEAEDLETEDDPTPEDDDPAGEKSLNQDDDEDEEEDGDSEADEEAAIPETYLRAAQYNGWETEEVTDFWKSNPKLAEKTFEKMHRSMNDLSRQFAQIGRTRMEMERGKQDKPAAQSQEAQDVIDIEALRKADPDNELLPIVEGMNKALKQLMPRQEAQSRPEERQSGNQDDLALATQIITFLGSDPMKSYGDFYGPAYDENRMPVFDTRTLTPGQEANRRALISRADEIWIGAKMHGRELTVNEALQMSHSLLTEGIREQKVREELVGKVKKRAKGMTLRPTGKGLPQSKEGKPKTAKELEARTEARLRKLRS